MVSMIVTVIVRINVTVAVKKKKLERDGNGRVIWKGAIYGLIAVPNYHAIIKRWNGERLELKICIFSPAVRMDWCATRNINCATRMMCYTYDVLSHHGRGIIRSGLFIVLLTNAPSSVKIPLECTEPRCLPLRCRRFADDEVEESS